MSLLQTGVYYGPDNPIWIKAPISSLTISTATIQNLYGFSSIFQNVSTNYIEAVEAYVNDKLTLDNQALTANATSLLLNGVPIATEATISSLADWSYDPAVSTVDMANNNIINLSTLNGKYANLTALNVIDIYAKNIMTSNLVAFNIINFNSTVIETYTSSVISQIDLARISSAQVGYQSVSTIDISSMTAQAGILSTLNVKILDFDTANGLDLNLSTLYCEFIDGVSTATFNTLNVSTLNASSITYSQSTNTFSNLTVISNLNVGTQVSTNNVTTNGLAVSGSASFNNGANFYGTRANFTTGINTSGPNNWNFQGIDNVGYVNGKNTSITSAGDFYGGGVLNLTADAGTFTTFYGTINMIAQYGGGGFVNIVAERPSLAVLVPTQEVRITCRGGCGYVTGLPVGGAVNIKAERGTTSILTPTTILQGQGVVRLTAESIFGTGAVPGLINLSGGAGSWYSGLTTPSAFNVYGCTFISALTCLSLTAGISPTTASYAGTVYLRGDNGTKVLNGLYVDNLYNALGYNLNISGTLGGWVNITTCQYLGMGNNPVIDGGSTNGVIQNFSSITSQNINTTNISTGSITLPQVYTSHINIAPYSTVYITNPDLTIYANLTTDTFTASQPNNLNLFASSNVNIQAINTMYGGGGSINIQCTNNPIYSINLYGNTNVSKTLAASAISTNNINLSTINGAPYTGGGGGGGGSVVSTFQNLYTSSFTVSSINGTAYPPANTWVSTAVGQLNMALSPINGVSNVSGSNISINATNLATVVANDGVGNYTELDVSSASLVMTQVGASGYIQRTAAGNIIDIANKNIQTQATSTINTVPHTFFTGDINAKALVNLSTINGVAYSAASVVSSYTTLSASSFTVSTINGLKYSAPGWVSTATGKLNMNGYNIQDSTGSNLITLSNGINIQDSHGSAITFDTLGEISFTGLKQFFVYNYYGDEININNGMYFFPAFQFYVDNTGNGHPGIFTLASASGIEANEIYLTTDFSVGTGSGNINISSISNVSVYAGGTLSNQASKISNVATLSTINTSPETTFSGDVKVSSFTQTLIGNPVLQPVLQYGFISTSGSSGTVTVTIPQRYTTQGSYIPFATMMDAPAAQLFTSSISRGSFLIGWSSGGSGSQLFGWQTMGT